MKFLMRVTMDLDTTNKLVKKGKLAEVLGEILGELKPEAAYFVAESGQRTGYFVFNLEHANEMIKYSEPFFLALDADIELMPLMTPDDLAQGGHFLDEAAKKFS